MSADRETKSGMDVEAPISHGHLSALAKREQDIGESQLWYCFCWPWTLVLCTQTCHVQKTLKFTVKNVPLRSWQHSSRWYHLLIWEIYFNYQVSLCCSLLNVWFQRLFSFFWTGPCIELRIFSLPCRQSDIWSVFVITIANSFSSELAENWIWITSQALAFSLCSTDILWNQAIRLDGVWYIFGYLSWSVDTKWANLISVKMLQDGWFIVVWGLKEPGLWIRPWASRRPSDSPSAEHLWRGVGELN